MDAAFGNNPLRYLFPLFPEGLLQAQFLGVSRVLGPAALSAAGAASAALAAVPGRGDKLALPLLCIALYTPAAKSAFCPGHR